MNELRRVFQVAVLGSVIYLALGWGAHSFENFCPFGGIESMHSMITSGRTSCAISPWNFAVFFGVIGLTLIAKKSFCSWVCPIGFIYEILGKVQNKLFKGKQLPPRKADRYLRLLKWAVLIAVLYPTYTTSELIFRGYDPYYIIFSGLGHGTIAVVSIAIIAALLISGLIVRMSWCRYLCPMSAAMDLFSYPSPLVIRRDPGLCKSCNQCDKECDHDLNPSRFEYITDVDCSNCLKCAVKCPEEGCMSLELHNRFRRTGA